MSEPRASLFMDDWHAARQRAAVFVSLLDHMERGWFAFRPLQIWIEAHKDKQEDGDNYAHLLNFADGDVSDVFLMIGRGVAALVPGLPGWKDEADPADLDGWLESLGRYLKMLRLASESAEVPDEFRGLMRSVTDQLDGQRWSAQMANLLASAGLLIAAADGEGSD